MKKERWFKLINKHFSEIDQEWQWTYLLLTPIDFNEQKIAKITITDHYKQEHDEVMSNEKILEIVKKLDDEIMKPEPKKKPNWPDVFVPKGLEYQNKRYLIVLWFERNSLDWLYGLEIVILISFFSSSNS